MVHEKGTEMNLLDGYDVIGDDVLGDAPMQSAPVQRPVLEWDNHNTYTPGEIVYFGQKHWKAMRDVTPPLLPSFMKGDEPGTSDAWAEVSERDVYGGHVGGDEDCTSVLGDDVEDDLAASYSVTPGEFQVNDDGEGALFDQMLGEIKELVGDDASAPAPEDEDATSLAEGLVDDTDEDLFEHGHAINTHWDEIVGVAERMARGGLVIVGEGYLHGCDVLGDVGVDINAANKAIRGLRPMSAAQGQKLLDFGISALTMANMHDSGHPGAVTRRSNYIAQLRDMKNTLAASKADPIPENSDPSKSPAEILRNAVLNAIDEYNAVAQENADMEHAREQLYQDIVDNAKALPGAVANAVVNNPFVSDVAWYAKMTTWAVIGAVVLVGAGAYKLLSSQGASNFLGAYMGARHR